MCPGPGSVLCRQELEERCLLKVCQTWEERAEEHLTMKQEEGEGGPSREVGGGPSQCRGGPQSLGWLVWVGYRPADHSTALCPSQPALGWRHGAGQKVDPTPLPSSLPEWSLNERSKPCKALLFLEAFLPPPAQAHSLGPLERPPGVEARLQRPLLC